jgi:hypothetical protein
VAAVVAGGSSVEAARHTPNGSPGSVKGKVAGVSLSVGWHRGAVWNPASAAASRSKGGTRGEIWGIPPPPATDVWGWQREEEVVGWG